MVKTDEGTHFGHAWMLWIERLVSPAPCCLWTFFVDGQVYAKGRQPGEALARIHANAARNEWFRQQELLQQSSSPATSSPATSSTRPEVFP
jgi:hypothetical protein